MARRRRMDLASPILVPDYNLRAVTPPKPTRDIIFLLAWQDTRNCGASGIYVSHWPRVGGGVPGVLARARSVRYIRSFCGPEARSALCRGAGFAASTSTCWIPAQQVPGCTCC